MIYEIVGNLQIKYTKYIENISFDKKIIKIELINHKIKKIVIDFSETKINISFDEKVLIIQPEEIYIVIEENLNENYTQSLSSKLKYIECHEHNCVANMVILKKIYYTIIEYLKIETFSRDEIKITYKIEDLAEFSKIHKKNNIMEEINNIINKNKICYDEYFHKKFKIKIPINNMKNYCDFQMSKFLIKFKLKKYPGDNDTITILYKKNNFINYYENVNIKILDKIIINIRLNNFVEELKDINKEYLKKITYNTDEDICINLKNNNIEKIFVTYNDNYYHLNYTCDNKNIIKKICIHENTIVFLNSLLISNKSKIYEIYSKLYENKDISNLNYDENKKIITFDLSDNYYKKIELYVNSHDIIVSKIDGVKSDEVDNYEDVLEIINDTKINNELEEKIIDNFSIYNPINNETDITFKFNEQKIVVLKIKENNQYVVHYYKNSCQITPGKFLSIDDMIEDIKKYIESKTPEIILNEKTTKLKKIDDNTAILVLSDVKDIKKFEKYCV